MRSSTLRPPVANGGSCPRTSHPTRRCREITLHRRVGWEVLGQLPPLATGGRNVEDRIYHRSHVCRTRTTERRCRRQKRLHHKPLCISRIASISQALAPIMSTSDFSPGHRALPRIFANPKESQLAEITQLLFQSGS